MDKKQIVLPQKYIQYNDYSDRLIQSMQYFLNNKNFLDLTIVCGNHSFGVHRLILSSLSPYFYNILKKETNNNPTIILNDVPYEIMQKILVFMYSGSIKLDPDHVGDFIKVAKRFQIISNTNIAVQYIRGELKDEIVYQNIAQDNMEISAQVVSTPELVPEVKEKLKQNENITPGSSKQVSTTIKIENESGPSKQRSVDKKNIKKEKKPRVFGSRADRELVKNPFLLDYNTCLDDRNNSSARVRPITYLLRKRDSTDNSSQESKDSKSKLPKKEPDALCEICNKYYSQGTLNRHMQIHKLADYFFECEDCKRLFKSYNSIYSHRYRIHGLLKSGKRKNFKQGIKKEND